MRIIMLLSLFMSFSALAETINFGVKGMVCSMCAQGIKKKFKAMGIDPEKVKVDLDKKIVSVDNDKNIKLTDQTITDAIKDAGYEVVDIKRQ
jgi:mercuric ion binding protein